MLESNPSTYSFSERQTIYSEPKKKTLLIIDDSEADRTLYGIWLNQSEEYHIIEADNTADGYAACLKYRPSCIILDFMMHGANGSQFVVQMKEGGAIIPPIIFVTAMPFGALQEYMSASEINIYLDKAKMNQQVLCDTIKRALS